MRTYVCYNMNILDGLLGFMTAKKYLSYFFPFDKIDFVKTQQCIWYNMYKSRAKDKGSTN